MSTSRDNLPAVPEAKTPTLIGTLWAVAEWVVKRELLMRVVSVVALVALGGATVVYGQGYLDGGTEKALEPVKADVAAVKVKAEATDRRLDALNAKFDNSEERNARRFEVLYNAILERKPQPGADALMRTDGGK